MQKTPTESKTVRAFVFFNLHYSAGNKIHKVNISSSKLMFVYKLFRNFVKAHIHHRNKGNDRAHGENYVKREYVTQESVHQHGNRRAANRRRIDKS